MPRIKVARKFILKDANDKMTEYDVGEYDVPQEVADDWYVAAHLEGYQAPEPKRGTQQFAERALQVAQVVRQGAGIPTPGGSPSSQPRDMRGAVPGVGTDRSGEPEPFAGRQLPRGPAEMAGFTDPRTLWPLTGESKSADRRDDPQRVGLDWQGAGGGAMDPAAQAGSREPVPGSGESKSADRRDDPQRAGLDAGGAGGGASAEPRATQKPNEPVHPRTPEQQRSWKEQPKK